MPSVSVVEVAGVIKLIQRTGKIGHQRNKLPFDNLTEMALTACVIV